MALTTVLSIVGVFAWAGYELVLRRRDNAETASWRGDSGDRGSTKLLLVCYVAAAAVNVVCSAAAIGQIGSAGRWLGVAVLGAGLVVRAWGMRVLGAFYTRTLRAAPTQRVIQEGPYRLIRHPGYAGSLLVWLGYSIGLGSWVATLFVAVVLGGAYLWRIGAEETMLRGAFGDEYVDYQRRSKRLVPYIY